MKSASPEMLLEAEKAAPQHEPTWAAIEEVVTSMGPNGSGYMTLSHRSRGYVQAAGTRLRMTVELRQYDTARNFHHIVFGRPSNHVTDASVNTAAGTIKLKSNEILTARDALLICRSFFDAAPIPAEFVTRETTEMFRE